MPTCEERHAGDSVGAAIKLPSITRDSATGSLRARTQSSAGYSGSDEVGYRRQLDAVQRNYASLSRVVSIKQQQLDEVRFWPHHDGYCGTLHASNVLAVVHCARAHVAS
jgi:hypothetical protein